jgi:hypothetical protein
MRKLILLCLSLLIGLLCYRLGYKKGVSDGYARTLWLAHVQAECYGGPRNTGLFKDDPQNCAELRAENPAQYKYLAVDKAGR